MDENNYMYVGINPEQDQSKQAYQKRKMVMTNSQSKKAKTMVFQPLHNSTLDLRTPLTSSNQVLQPLSLTQRPANVVFNSSLFPKNISTGSSNDSNFDENTAEASIDFTSEKRKAEKKDKKHKTNPPTTIEADITKAILVGVNVNAELNKQKDINDAVELNESLVENNESSKSIDEEDLVTPQKKVKAKQIKDWQYKCEYDNMEVAVSALKQEDTWSVFRKKDTADGPKWFYRCNKAKLRGKQCSAEVYLLFKNDSDKVAEYRKNSPHDHVDQSRELEEKERLRVEVEKLLSHHRKPNDIMHALSEMDGIVLPTKGQLTNLIADIKRKKIGSPTISLQELTKWLQDHSEIPEDEHEPFVLCYQVDAECVEPYFRFMITTKYLLNLAKHRNLTHSDATYKCIWQGFPVFMIGTTDLDKAYHSYALSVCSDEKTPDFKFIFEGIKNGLLRVFQYESHQTTIVCDAAFAIINAFQEVYGDQVTVIMCWYHAKTAMEKHLTLVKKENMGKILQDIEFLHLASSPVIFRNAVAAFLNKWVREEDEYCKYFLSEWIEKHPNWYLGAAEFTPCQNNALESSNRYLKDSHTIRIRHPLAHFLKVAMDATHKWSKRYIIGLKTFALEPTISTKLWTNAFNWARSNIQSKIISQDKEKMTVVVDAEIGRAKKRETKDLLRIEGPLNEVLEILAEERLDQAAAKGRTGRKINETASTNTPQPTTAGSQTRKGRKGRKKDEAAEAGSQMSDEGAPTITPQPTISGSQTRKGRKGRKKDEAAEAGSQMSDEGAPTITPQPTITGSQTRKGRKGRKNDEAAEAGYQMSDVGAPTITSQPTIAGSQTRKGRKGRKKDEAAEAGYQMSNEGAPTITPQLTTAGSQTRINDETVEAGSMLSQPVAIFSRLNQPVGEVVVPVDEFDKYKLTFTKWTVTISKRPNNLTDGRCNCPAFAKDYICKHIVGLSIRMKYVSAPPEAKTVPLGQRRKRGRPTKTKPALLIQ